MTYRSTSKLAGLIAIAALLWPLPRLLATDCACPKPKVKISAIHTITPTDAIEVSLGGAVVAPNAEPVAMERDREYALAITVTRKSGFSIGCNPAVNLTFPHCGIEYSRDSGSTWTKGTRTLITVYGSGNNFSYDPLVPILLQITAPPSDSANSVPAPGDEANPQSGPAAERYLLLRAPAVLSGFEGTDLRVVKAPLDGADAYYIIAGAAGRLTGTAVFEMPLADPVKGWLLPSGPAAMRRVSVRWDQPGWEFVSAHAAKVMAIDGLPATSSGAVLVLGPADSVSIQARAKQRDVGAEEVRFFAEVSNLFLPGPGVVNGRHRVAVRPAQGRMSAMVMKVPDGFTVSDVTHGPVGSWRFDPGTRELRVAVEPAQAKAFPLTIETQRGAGALPMELELEPLRVDGSAGEIGFLALAFGDEAQPERVDVNGLSRVNPEDFM
jgi:hypothetical protein